MQVYIVEKGEYSDRYIIGVFSTIEKAQECLEMEKFTEDYNNCYSIDSWKIDEYHGNESTDLILINGEIYNYHTIKWEKDWLDEFDYCNDRVSEITKDWMFDYFKKHDVISYKDDFMFEDKEIKFPIYIVKGVIYNPNKDVMKKVVYDSIAKYKAEKEGI